MSEFHHPPIDTRFMHDISLEREFAERACEILNTYKVEEVTTIGDYKVTYPVSDRVDMISQDPNVETALRLIRHPSFATNSVLGEEASTGSTLVAAQPSADYVAISLQVGVLAEEYDEEEFIVDEHFSWRSYVTAIVSRTGETMVVDSQTGKDLASGDLLQAGYIMELLRHELRGIVFESNLEIDDSPITYTLLKTRYKELPQGEELDLNYACNICGSTNSPCGHLNSQMN